MLSPAQALFTLMAERSELSTVDLRLLPRKLLEVASRMRCGETLHRDDDLVDYAAHAIKAAALESEAGGAPAVPVAQLLTAEQKYALIKEHLGLERRHDDTLVDPRTGRYTAPEGHFALIDAAVHRGN